MLAWYWRPHHRNRPQAVPEGISRHPYPRSRPRTVPSHEREDRASHRHQPCQLAVEAWLPSCACSEVKWCSRVDLNHQHAPSEDAASARLGYVSMVHPAGVEPATKRFRRPLPFQLDYGCKDLKSADGSSWHCK